MEILWSYIRRLFRPLWDWFRGIYETFNGNIDNDNQYDGDVDNDGEVDQDGNGLLKLPHRKTLKCNIINVIKNEDHINKIIGKVLAISKLRIACTHILKLYIIILFTSTSSIQQQ